MGRGKVLGFEEEEKNSIVRGEESIARNAKVRVGFQFYKGLYNYMWVGVYD